jgi:hypothetical protein
VGIMAWEGAIWSGRQQRNTIWSTAGGAGMNSLRGGTVMKTTRRRQPRSHLDFVYTACTAVPVRFHWAEDDEVLTRFRYGPTLELV